jgi:hypothetical protein
MESTRRMTVPAALALAALLAAGPGGASTADNGTFRYLTDSLPTGSQNAEYVARILVANSDGPVTFGATGLPAGLVLDPQSGFITGRPTENHNGDVDFSADDGTTTINNAIHLQVTASGGGGNEGATFDLSGIGPGTVGESYTGTLAVDNGVSPYTFGAVDLPPGLSLDGQTGALAGTPSAAGTYFVAFSVFDAGDGNKSVKIAPVVIDPADSDFRFTTRFLNNGEVGTVYWDQWAVSGASGSVSYGASGLPAGLAVNASTGEVGGTPTVAGTFTVRVSASDANDTIVTNLVLTIVPSSTSSLYWEYFGLPTGFAGVDYSRQPPVLMVAKNGTSVTYAATGLPAGITYGAATGILAGTPTEAGEYTITFTATDTGPEPDQVLTLALDFVVLPPTGGDSNSLTTNFWVRKAALRAGGDPGEDSWTGDGYWNADRRTGSVFDPAADPFGMLLGSHPLDVAAGTWTGTVAKYSFRTPKGEAPARDVDLSPVKQTLKWSTKADTIAEAVPATLRHSLLLGGKGYRLDEAFDGKGKFKPALAFRKVAFVVTKGSVSAPGAGNDAVNLSGYLHDPAMEFEAGVTLLRVRILDGITPLFDRDFTVLGTGTTAVDRATGATYYKLKGAKDEAEADRVSKFSFAGNSGKITLNLADMTLAGVPAGEAHLGIEITVGSRIYYTAVTFFEGKPGKFSTTMPAN